MAVSKDDIRRWFKEGQKEKATHMIVVVDTFDYGDFPVYVKPGQDVREVEKAHNDLDKMLKVMEVYNLTLDMEAQMAEHRSFHREPVVAQPELEVQEQKRAERKRAARKWAMKKRVARKCVMKKRTTKGKRKK